MQLIDLLCQKKIVKKITLIDFNYWIDDFYNWIQWRCSRPLRVEQAKVTVFDRHVMHLSNIFKLLYSYTIVFVS